MFKEIGNPWWKSLCDSVSPYGKMKKKGIFLEIANMV
jgi:hypothetical protein